jgi:uncharacterized repeat protein (TIGR03806 family)
MRRSKSFLCAAAALLLGTTHIIAQARVAAAPHGLHKRVATQPFLGMPDNPSGSIPRLLSKTGAFADLRRLVPAKGLMPYELVVPFWSDGAAKSRLIAVPGGTIGFAPAGEWSFPKGTVFVKTFEMPTDARNPALRRRLETRLLMVGSDGGVFGVVYKWRPDNSDAELLEGSVTEEIRITDKDGTAHRQSWYYPSREDCLACHNAKAGGVLGVKTRQMNRDLKYPTGINDNQLRAWNHIGLFSPALDEAQIPALPSLIRMDDTSRSPEDRARSYLDANCAQCHRPGGTVAYFDARFDTALPAQSLVDGPVLIDQGIDRARVISPHDFWRSIAFMRMNTVGDVKMPPLARQTIDSQGVELMREWILSLPGRKVLDPPVISPAGGSFNGSVEVTLASPEPDAEIRYTLDGSAPGASDKRYDRPIRLDAPATVRARVVKEGLTRSIIAQETFIPAN